jgi:hypothetical protein
MIYPHGMQDVFTMLDCQGIRVNHCYGVYTTPDSRDVLPAWHTWSVRSVMRRRADTRSYRPMAPGCWILPSMALVVPSASARFTVKHLLTGLVCVPGAGRPCGWHDALSTRPQWRHAQEHRQGILAICHRGIDAAQHQCGAHAGVGN